MTKKPHHSDDDVMAVEKSFRHILKRQKHA